MSPADLATLALLNLVGAASPGPDVILVTRQATRSRKHAIASVLGIHVGVLFWTSLTVFGAAALLTAFPQILEVVQVLGGAWLVYLGQGMLRGGWADRFHQPVDLAEAEGRLGTLGQSFRTGIATNLANPKIVLFLAALIAPLLPPSPSLGTALAVIVALAAGSLSLFVVISLFVSTHAVRNRLLRVGWLIDVIAGLFFLLVGAALIIRGLAGLMT